MSNPAEVKVRTLFPTLFLETGLPDAEQLNAELKDTILGNRARSKGIQRSNFNGWHSTDDMLEWGGEAARKVAETAIATCNPYTYDTGLKEGADARYAWAVQMWANVSEAGASNQYHAHPGAFWSSVYYVDDGGDQASGMLVLQDPRFPLNKMTVPDLTVRDTAGNTERSEINLLPKPGRLIAFPGWLTHGVKPYNGPRERISIAMNLLAVPVKK